MNQKPPPTQYETKTVLKFETEITVTDKDRSIVAGKSKHFTRGGNEHTGITLHRWYEATGQAASWVSPQKIDFGVLDKGSIVPKISWSITVPENTRPGFYTFSWEEHCEFIPSKNTCVFLSINKYHIEVLPKASTLTSVPQSGGGCLIATATFGSELAPQVQQLREIRDNSLLQTESGRSFMELFNQFYYSFSPEIADLERENPVFKEAVKLTITPLLASLSLLNYVEMDSEYEVLGYGISLIILNVGMYFVAPVIVIVKLPRFLVKLSNKEGT